MEKPYKTLDEQINLLKSRNLIFLDEAYAKKILARYGYYEIINGYKNFLIDNRLKEEFFKDSATFEHIFALYQLDKKIRNSVLTTTLEIECSLRTALAHVVSKFLRTPTRIVFR